MCWVFQSTWPRWELTLIRSFLRLQLWWHLVCLTKAIPPTRTSPTPHPQPQHTPRPHPQPHPQPQPQHTPTPSLLPLRVAEEWGMSPMMQRYMKSQTTSGAQDSAFAIGSRNQAPGIEGSVGGTSDLPTACQVSHSIVGSCNYKGRFMGG